MESIPTHTVSCVRPGVESACRCVVASCVARAGAWSVGRFRDPWLQIPVYDIEQRLLQQITRT